MSTLISSPSLPASSRDVCSYSRLLASFRRSPHSREVVSPKARPKPALNQPCRDGVLVETFFAPKDCVVVGSEEDPVTKCEGIMCHIGTRHQAGTAWKKGMQDGEFDDAFLYSESRVARAPPLMFDLAGHM